MCVLQLNQERTTFFSSSYIHYRKGVVLNRNASVVLI